MLKLGESWANQAVVDHKSEERLCENLGQVRES